MSLDVDVAYEFAATLNFSNTYSATGSLTLSGTKTLVGRALLAGEFEFELYEGVVLLETVSHAADGSISFAAMNYTLNDVGTKTYTVKEVLGTLDDIVYATNEYTVTVKITDNGDGTLDVDVTSGNATALDFVNIQELVLPETGETNPSLIPGILLLLIALALLAYYVNRKRATR